MVGLDSCTGVPASCTGVLSTDEMKGLAIGVRGSLVETFVVVGEPGTVPMLDPVAGMRDARVSPKEKGVPPHCLQLKPGDICLVMRNLSKRFGLATNSRVLILSISKYCIRVQTVGPSPKISTIPRIRFRFKIPGGASFEVTRTQFPLRLAYCMTYNKAQGQTLQCVLLDITSPPFAHGHLYVALSRVTHYANIKVFCNENFICDDAPLLSNIVYPELLPD